MKPPGPLKKAWYDWKMLRFPWRKRWLVGFDLQGNTFWEFKDALHSLRNRRIAKYARSTHYGDVNVSPAWMQWLRHTRFEPPSVQEQQAELRRQEGIKLLAARADERWAAKPSALDGPARQQPVQRLGSGDPKSGVAQVDAEGEARGLEARIAQARHTPDTPPQNPPTQEPPFTAKKKLRTNKPPKEDSPWKQHAGNPGDDWQPKAWTPPPR